MLSIRVAVSWASSLILLASVTHGHAQDAEPIAPPVESPDWRTLDPALAKAVEEFDLDAYIKKLNPPTVEEIITSLKPIPTLEQILELVRDPSKRTEFPTLPDVVAEEVADLETKIEEHQKLGLIAPTKQEQDAALAKATALAERVVKLRDWWQGGDLSRDRQGVDSVWFELADARQAVTTLRTLRTLGLAHRAAVAAAAEYNQQGEMAFDRGDLTEAESAWRSALVLYERLFPADHADVAAHLNNLAFVLKMRGDLAGADLLFRNALATKQRIFAGNHPLVAAGTTSLASVCGMRGESGMAEQLQRGALVMHLHLFTDDHPDVAVNLNNLGLALHAIGDRAEAELLLRESLEMLQRLFPNDHPDVAGSLSNFARVLRERGEFVGAESHYRTAMEMRKRLLPGDSAVVSRSLSDLAIALSEQDDLGAAEAFHRDSLAMRQRLFPSDHPDVASSLNLLAGVLKARGDLAGAELLYRDALSMRRRLFHGDHGNVVTSLNNLAGILRFRGDLAGAESLYQSALAMSQRIYPGDHQHVAGTLNNLGLALSSRGELAMAESLHRDALEMLKRLLPDDHYHVVVGTSNVATVLRKRGDFAAAESLYCDALAKCRRLFSGDHRLTATTLNNLASLLHAKGDLLQAEALYRDALAMRQRLFPGDHTAVAHSLNKLASVIIARGVPDEAEPLYRNSLVMKERLRTQIIGAERERAVFSEELQLAKLSESYAGLLARLGRGTESLAVLERGRSRSVLDLLERRDCDVDTEAKATGDETGSSKFDAAIAAEDQSRIELASTEALLGGRTRERQALTSREDLEESTKTKRLAKYDREIAELKKKVESQRQAFAQAGAAVLTELRGLFPSAKPLTTEEILSSLSPDELVLSLAWSDDALLTATAGRNGGAGMTNGHVTVDSKEAMAGLEAQATMIREAIATRPASSDSADLRSAASTLLSALVPEEIRASVETAKRLVVIPDGPLHGIPIEALVALAGDDSIAGLLADKHIVYAPSATMYLDRRQVARQQTGAGEISVVVLGDPIFDRKPLPEPDYPQEGVLLAMVAPESNASRAGLSRGDVLLSYAGTKLPDREALGPAIASVNEAVESGARKADEQVKVSFWRDGKTQEATLSPGRMGVQHSGGAPADILRAMARAERGYEQAAAGISATDQVRLHGGRLAPLPGTKREATAIAKTINGVGGDVITLLGEDATIGQLKSAVQGKRILHLATHGLTGSRDRPYDASLALTQPVEPTPDDIGFLTLDELMGSWLGRLRGCDLVVLSACDTGRGVKKGDSVMALPIGFFAAGAPTVIASLWQVNDLSTAILMEEFYANLIEKKMPKASALDEAKRSLRAMTWEELQHRAQMTEAELEAYTQSRGLGKMVTVAKGKLQGPFAHPYYWAPFILVGEPE